ncbi:hypothetical protein GBAR_LOCUS23580 [Geodia barretti]|uniref:Uncharacterized protein n=1 Tax=Geodia barretti TaxID=519541 RepID=A0AA35X386_GEOBA|nr:hypothetical protein GBAR_LOCUS23580 [Geodia barretti]
MSHHLCGKYDHLATLSRVVRKAKTQRVSSRDYEDANIGIRKLEHETLELGSEIVYTSEEKC